MKTKHISKKSKRLGFSVLELGILTALTIVLVIVLWPVTRHKRAPQIACVLNLKQIGVAFRSYADANDDKFPFQTSLTNESTELIFTQHVFPYFQKMSNELGKTMLLVCPSDRRRRAASGFETLTDSDISYFLNTDASVVRPGSIHSGDRFLQVDGQPVKPGLLVLTTNLNIGWQLGIHANGWDEGNLLFSDGSVIQSGSAKLKVSIRERQLLGTNRLLIP